MSVRKQRAEGRTVEFHSGGKIRGDDADLWLRDNDPGYSAPDRDIRRGVKRLPAELRKTA